MKHQKRRKTIKFDLEMELARLESEALVAFASRENPTLKTDVMDLLMVTQLSDRGWMLFFPSPSEEEQRRIIKLTIKLLKMQKKYLQKLFPEME